MNWDALQKNTFVKKEVEFGTVDASPVVTIDIGKGIKALRVINVNADSSKDLLISKDSGSTWRRVPSDSVREFIEEIKTLQIKGAASDCEYELEYLQYH